MRMLMDTYVLTVESWAGAGSILVTDSSGQVQAAFRRPVRPLLGCFTVVAAALAFLVTLLALAAGVMNIGDRLQLQRAVDQGSSLAAVVMVMVVALTFAIPFFVSFVIVNLCYPRFWFTLWDTCEPPERVLSVRERSSSWIGSFSVLDREDAVLAKIDRHLKSQEYRVRDRDGNVVLVMASGEAREVTRLGLVLRAATLFIRAYSRKKMGHDVFVGGSKLLVLFRPGAGFPDSHTKIGLLEATVGKVRIAFSVSELSEREKTVTLVLGAIALRG
jgi:hypothetical protein